MKNDKTDFTQGSILKKLALFMLPILGALVLQAWFFKRSTAPWTCWW